MIDSVISHLRIFVLVFLNEVGFFCNVYFGYSDRKCSNRSDKLPKYDRHVFKNEKQRDLNGTHSSGNFHHETKGSESKEHGVEAVKITSYNKGSVINHRV